MTDEKTNNTFAEMEGKTQEQAEPVPTSKAPTGEISVDDFSDTAVGDKVSYTRPDLNGTEDVIDKFQVFAPDTSKDPSSSLNKTSKYWKVQMTLWYGSKNGDGAQNREYISGARSFVNRDGSASEISFWYEGAETQCAYLWEKVAEKLNVKPEDLSPRQFVAFLNSKPKVKLYGQKTKNYNAGPNAPKHISKNMPEAFL